MPKNILRRSPYDLKERSLPIPFYKAISPVYIGRPLSDRDYSDICLSGPGHLVVQVNTVILRDDLVITVVSVIPAKGVQTTPQTVV